MRKHKYNTDTTHVCVPNPSKKVWATYVSIALRCASLWPKTMDPTYNYCFAVC